MSRAWMMPNDRIVRSCTSPVVRIDRDRLGEHPSERHVHRAERVGAQHGLVERIARGETHVDTDESPGRVVERDASAGACTRRRDDKRVEERRRRRSARNGRRRPRRARLRRARPAPRARTRAAPRPPAAPAPRPRATRRRRRCRRRLRTPRDADATAAPSITTRPSRHTAVAEIGGRFGPRRTTSSREYTTRTVRPRCAASSRAASGAQRVLLAAERAAVRERRRRLAAGLAPRRVGFEVRGLDPRRREPHAAVRHRQQRQRRTRRRPSCAGPAPCPRRCARLRPTRPTTQRIPAASTKSASEPGGSGTATSASRRRGVVGESATAERHVRLDALVHAAFERRPRRGRGHDRGAAPLVPCLRWLRTPCANRCSGTGGRPAPCRAAGRRAATARMMMPGVQNPHCDPPVADERGRAIGRALPGRALRRSSPTGPRRARPR